MKKILEAYRTRRTVAWLLTLIMILGTMTVTQGLASAYEQAEQSELVVGESISVADNVQVAPAAANPNYRNLNLTPGGAVSEMRFTWHSQSTSGSIRIYEAGSTTPLQTVGSTTRTLTSRSADSTWFPDVTPDYTVHQVIVTGLAPETNYEYVVVGTGFESARKSFRTGGGDNFSFLVGGDPQIGVGVQHHNLDLSGWLNTMSVAVEQVPDADFFLSVGDQVHTNNNNIPRSQYMYDILFAPPEFHNLPLIPVVGNHEAGAANSNGHLWHSHYNTLNPEGAGTILGNTRRHGAQYVQFDYYVRWGNMIMIALDSNTRTWGGERLQWFESVIEANQDAEWRVVTFHHPPYSVYRSTTDGAKTQIIQNWIPEFQRLEIDVVLSGHCHSYSRSHQMINNVPQLDQQWIDAEGQIQQGTDNTNAVLDPTGIVYLAFNSASGSGYYNVTAMANRHYIADWNQNFQRNFSVVDVTSNTFSVATYQVNDDSTTVLVDVYTIVRSDDNGNMPIGVVPRHMGDRQLGTFIRVESETIRDIPLGTALAVIGELLPTQVAIETDIHINDGGNPSATRNPGGVYGIRVKPLLADVTWDLNSIIPAFDPTLATQHTYTIRGEVNDVPDGVGGVTPPITVYIEVIVGFDPARPFDGYVSYFGARYRFYGRSNVNFMYDAFNPDIFSTWTGGGLDPLGSHTPIGFGSPRSLGEVGEAHFSGPLVTVIPMGASSYQRGTLGANGNPGLHTFTYFSRTFYLPEDFCVENLGKVRGAHHLDDNMLIFINGIEIYRINTHNQNATNIIIGHPVNWNTYVGHNTDARFRSFHINYDFSGRDSGYMRQNTVGANMFDAASRTNLELALQPGQNVITAVVGQNSATSSDLWFDLELYFELDTPYVGVMPEGPFTDTRPNALREWFDRYTEITLATRGNLGIFEHQSPFVIPDGVTLTVETALNSQRDAHIVIEGTLIIADIGRLNNQGNRSTITVADGGRLIIYGWVENVTGSIFINDGEVILRDSGRLNIRAGVSYCLECETFTNEGGILNINNAANRLPRCAEEE
ncbi:MAG: metallophosphoesterase family protein [Oscillospiraceae bacterium]|nr:metallophosphoesterase family protein [Oscillospiraceae bacterium]